MVIHTFRNLIVLNFILTFIYIASNNILYAKGSAITIIFPLYLIASYIIVTLNQVRIRFFKIHYFYLIYLVGIILLLSDDFLSSFKLLIKFSTSFLLFPIAISLFHKEKDLKKISGLLVIIAVLYVSNIVVANVLGLGGTKYSDEGLDVGNIFTEGLNAMAYILATLPLLIYFFPKYKYLLFALSALVAILVFIQLKRISILAIFFSLCMFVLLYQKNLKTLFGIVLIGIISFAVFLQFENIFTAQLEERQSKLQFENLENEGRTMEFFWIIENFDDDPIKWAFGHNMFNSPGNYSNPYSNERQIHSDYNALLHGSGIIGLLFFLGPQFYIFVLYMKARKIIRQYNIQSELIKIIFYLFPTVFFMAFLIMMSGGIYAYLFNGIRYLLLGSLLGYLYYIIHINKLKNATVQVH